MRAKWKPCTVLFPLAFVTAAALSTYWLFSDRLWVASVLERDVVAAAGQGGQEDAEAARRAVESALESGALGILLAARSVWILLRSHAVFLSVLLLASGLLWGRWELQGGFFCETLQSTWILGLGSLLDAGLRWWSVRLNATFSGAFLIESFDARLPGHQLAMKADLFAIVFLILVARSATRVHGASSSEALVLILGIWMIFNVGSWLLRVPFDLIL